MKLATQFKHNVFIGLTKIVIPASYVFCNSVTTIDYISSDNLNKEKYI